MRLLDNSGSRLSSIADNTVLRSIRKGFLFMIPLTMLGSISQVLTSFPIPAFQQFLDSVFTPYWREVAQSIYRGTFSVMSIMLLLSVSYIIASEDQGVKEGRIVHSSAMFTAFGAYIAYFGMDGDILIDPAHARSTGLFSALLIAILSTKLFLLLFNIPKLRLRLYSNDTDAAMLSSMMVFLPVALTISAFALARVLLGVSNLAAAANSLIQGLEASLIHNGRNLVSTLIFIFISNLLWFLGLHGTNMLDGVANSLFVTASETNIGLAAAGQAPTEIFTKEFLDAFVYMGGSGVTLGLIIALLLNRTNGMQRKFGVFSLLPGLFNINEIIVYGLPIIFNPYYIIPFLATPMLLSVTSYVALRLGLVPLTTHRILWTTPALLSGYTATGSIAGALLQVFNLTCAVLVYYPFVQMARREQEKTGMVTYEDLVSETKSALREIRPRPILSRTDDIGGLARHMIDDIEDGLSHNRVPMHLEFQPKLTYDGKVVGAEALMRWNHPTFGKIPAIATMSLVDEANLTNQVGIWVMNTGFEALKKWHSAGFDNLSLSVNINPMQLWMDDKFMEEVRRTVKRIGLPTQYLELEMTENVTIDRSGATKRKLSEIRDMGLNISIDDFGMGHSSLLYLRDYYANIVKIDMSLVRGITDNRQSQEIIRSLTQLCSQFNVKIVAEGVETKEQLDMLHELGCHIYQGYYFSPALPFDDFIAYVKEHGTADPLQ